MFEDVLSLVIEYVDSLDKNPARVRLVQPLSVVGGAECRLVSRTWCGVVDAAIGRDLPPMPSESLAALLAPGKLRGVLLSCRYLADDYNHHHHQNQNATFASYNRLVSRADTCAVHLRDVAMRAASHGRGAGRSYSRVSGDKLSSSSSSSSRSDSSSSSSSSGSSGSSSSSSSSSSSRSATSSSINTDSAMICRRVALKRIVGQVLASSAFSWCSTLGPEASRLLEGCVGASCLLDARWFSG